MPTFKEILQYLATGVRDDFLARFNQLYTVNPQLATLLAVSYWTGKVGAGLIRSRRDLINNMNLSNYLNDNSTSLGNIIMFKETVQDRFGFNVSRMYIDENSVKNLNEQGRLLIDSFQGKGFIKQPINSTDITSVSYNVILKKYDISNNTNSIVVFNFTNDVTAGEINYNTIAMVCKFNALNSVQIFPRLTSAVFACDENLISLNNRAAEAAVLNKYFFTTYNIDRSCTAVRNNKLAFVFIEKGKQIDGLYIANLFTNRNNETKVNIKHMINFPNNLGIATSGFSSFNLNATSVCVNHEENSFEFYNSNSQLICKFNPGNATCTQDITTPSTTHPSTTLTSASQVTTAPSRTTSSSSTITPFLTTSSYASTSISTTTISSSSNVTSPLSSSTSITSSPAELITTSIYNSTDHSNSTRTDEDNRDSANVGAIVGGVLGSVIALGVVSYLLYRKYKTRLNYQNMNQDKDGGLIDMENLDPFTRSKLRITDNNNEGNPFSTTYQNPTFEAQPMTTIGKAFIDSNVNEEINKLNLELSTIKDKIDKLLEAISKKSKEVYNGNVIIDLVKALDEKDKGIKASFQKYFQIFKVLCEIRKEILENERKHNPRGEEITELLEIIYKDYNEFLQLIKRTLSITELVSNTFKDVKVSQTNKDLINNLEVLRESINILKNNISKLKSELESTIKSIEIALVPGRRLSEISSSNGSETEYNLTSTNC